MNDNKLRTIVSQILGVVPESLTDQSSPDTIHGWDSVKTMDLVLAIEEEFGVRLSDDQIESLLSFKLIKLALAEATKVRPSGS